MKWIESAGGRVVPIPYDTEPQKLEVLLNSINGIIFPGGDASLWEFEKDNTGFSEMTRVGQKIIKTAIEMNIKGE